MTLKPYIIAPFKSGFQEDVKPWLLPEDAFQTLEDAYVWRGRIRKRWGTILIGKTPLDSRLRIDIGTTDGAGAISLPTVPGVIFKVGQMFSIGAEIFTVVVAGLPGTMLATGAATVHTYDTTTGALVINAADATTKVFFYPSEPVMGLRLRESATISLEGTVAFDTQFAYERAGGAWRRLGTALWTGTDADFYWSTNYRGASAFDTVFYVVNYVRADGIRFLPEGSSTWTTLLPQLDTGATRFLESARLIIGFKDRLVALNTRELEGAAARTFRNRARWSQNGDPRNPSNSWLDDTPGRGGFIDAPTQEAIITAEFVKDRLVVYFERSTWELAYTGDSTLPFRWSQINNELGCESTFSVIGFDKEAIGVGNVGIHACNAVNVVRIDEKIPDKVFEIHNENDGPARVYGIRDFFQEMIYWTYPDATADPVFPTRVLTYNYRNQTWSIFNDSFTCFGYLQENSGLTWATVGDEFPTWAQWNQPWGSAFSQAAFPNVAAGNQNGFTFFVKPGVSSNARGLYITDMATGPEEDTAILTIVDHNLSAGTYIRVTDALGVTSLNSFTMLVDSVTDVDTVVVDKGLTGTYTGAGYATRVSNINILTKQFNPGAPAGQNFRFGYIDFLLNRTSVGELSVDYFLNSIRGDPVQKTAAGIIPGDNVLRTRPEANSGTQNEQSYIWHRYFLYASAAMIQLRFSMTDAQMKNNAIATSDFELQGMVLYAKPTGRITT